MMTCTIEVYVNVKVDLWDICIPYASVCLMILKQVESGTRTKKMLQKVESGTRTKQMVKGLKIK